MVKTLDEILTKNTKVLIDTNILLSGLEFNKPNSHLKTIENLDELEKYTSKLVEFSLNGNSQIYKGVYEEYRLIYNLEIRKYLDNLLFTPEINVQTRQKIIKLKSNYLKIKRNFRDKKIEKYQLNNQNILVQKINRHPKIKKQISETDIELFLLGFSEKLPIVTNDSDFIFIYDWFICEFNKTLCQELPLTYLPINFYEKITNRKYRRLF